MHLPDDFINSGAAAGLASAAVAAVGFAVRAVRSAFLEKVPVLKMRLATFPDFGGESGMSLQNRLSKYGREKVWRMATIGSLLFALQMMNFPITSGTSGHFLGGVLAAIIVGPFEALIVIALVLSVQAIVFGDGGIVALGANIFNMGVVGALGGYVYFRFLLKGAKEGKQIFLRSAFVAAWVSVIAASVTASFEMTVFGFQSLSSVLPAMVGIHIAIGCMEGLITAAILFFLLKKGFVLAISPEKTGYES